ncbi:MAG: hypothetical protein OXI88_02925 [Gammaproteobacteria bacterium]|nr:hypothetical protein [Gammaproteobacteria bacterium]
MIEQLKEIIKDRHYQTSETSDNNAVLLMDDNSGMEVRITKPANDWLVINIPDNHHLGMVDKGNWRKTCDKLILVAGRNQVDVYFIEMKKTLRPNQEDIPEDAFMQILCTIPTLDYLVSMVKNYFQEQYGIKQHYAVIYEKRTATLDKQRIKPQIADSYKFRRESFRCISSVSGPIDLDHLQFKSEQA